MAKGTGSCISGVGKISLGFFAFELACFIFALDLLIELKEAVLGHVNFAANLEHRIEPLMRNCSKTLARKVARDVRNGENIFRNVFADVTISSRSTAYELAVFVGKRNAQTVNFKLAGVGGRTHTLRSKCCLGAFKPCIKLF